MASENEDQAVPGRRYTGLDFYYERGHFLRPIESEVTSEDAQKWFKSMPATGRPDIRLLVYKRTVSERGSPHFKVPFAIKVLECALCEINARSYLDMVKLPWPARDSGKDGFLLQTPQDNQLFVSMAFIQADSGRFFKNQRYGFKEGRHPVYYEGIYTYDDEDMNPVELLRVAYQPYQRNGIWVFVFRVIEANFASMAARLETVLQSVHDVDSKLAEPDRTSFASLQRTMVECRNATHFLGRRSKFQDVALASLVSKNPASGPLEAVKMGFDSDLALLASHIERTSGDINDAMIQRTQSQSLRMAESSHRIAEATMKDSASMRTIAILTMVFLPGTAVASFFSMAMWNWTAQDGTSLASKWLWIYFVVSIPLTIVVLAIWWFTTGQRLWEERSLAPGQDLENQGGNGHASIKGAKDA